MITIEPTIKIYDDEGNLSRAYDKAVDKMIDKTYNIDLEQFDFDEVAKGKSKELDNLVAKLCKESGLGSKDIYTMLLDRFEAEYDVPVDFVVYLGKDWEDDFEESKKSTKKSIKESNYDLINDDLLAMLKGSCKQLTYAISDYEGNYSDRSLKELQRKLEEVEDFCNKVLYQVNKRK